MYTAGHSNTNINATHVATTSTATNKSSNSNSTILPQHQLQLHLAITGLGVNNNNNNNMTKSTNSTSELTITTTQHYMNSKNNHCPLPPPIQQKQITAATTLHQQLKTLPPSQTLNHAQNTNNKNNNNIANVNASSLTSNDSTVFSTLSQINTLSLNSQKTSQQQPPTASKNRLQGPITSATNLLFVRPANPSLHVGKLPFLPVQFL